MSQKISKQLLDNLEHDARKFGLREFIERAWELGRDEGRRDQVGLGAKIRIPMWASRGEQVVLDGEKCRVAGIFAGLDHEDGTKSINVPVENLKPACGCTDDGVMAPYSPECSVHAGMASSGYQQLHAERLGYEELWVREDQCDDVSPDRAHSCTIRAGHPGAHVAIDPVFGAAMAAWPNRHKRKEDGASPPPPLANNELRSCWCYRCLDAPEHGLNNPVRTHMIVCPACSNKRCPRATDHRFACTGVNVSGQFGSNYADRISKHYEGHRWIRVPKHDDDPTLHPDERYARLEEHHRRETEFLIAEVRKLAALVQPGDDDAVREVLGPPPEVG